MNIETPDDDTLVLRVGFADRRVLFIDLFYGLSSVAAITYGPPLSGLAMLPWPFLAFYLLVVLFVIAGLLGFLRAVKMLLTVQTWTFRRDLRSVRHVRRFASWVVVDTELEFRGITTSPRLVRSISLVLRILPIYRKRISMHFMHGDEESLDPMRTVDTGGSARKALALADQVSALTGVENLSG